MTDREKAIVMAYTGKCMLSGDKFKIFHKYVEGILGRSIMTHEIGLLADEIKAKSKIDFIALCADDIHHDRVVQDFADKCRECGKQEKVQWIEIDETHSKCKGCGAIFCITASNEWKVNFCPNCGKKISSVILATYKKKESEEK